MRNVPLTEARARLGELVDQVRYGGEAIGITKGGKAGVVLVPAYIFEEWKAHKDQAFRVLDDIWALNLGQPLTEEESMAWAVEAVDLARREIAAERAAEVAAAREDKNQPVAEE